MASLNPASGATLIDTNQDQFVTANVTAVAFDSIEQWTWDIQGVTSIAPDNPPNFVVTPDGPVLHVAYQNYDGLFLLEDLKYLTPDREVVRVSGFDELPALGQSPEIIEMIASPVNILVWSIFVKVRGYSTPAASPPPAPPPSPVMTEITATYTIKVEANYSINRDELVEAVNARR